MFQPYVLIHQFVRVRATCSDCITGGGEDLASSICEQNMYDFFTFEHVFVNSVVHLATIFCMLRFGFCRPNKVIALL